MKKLSLQNLADKWLNRHNKFQDLKKLAEKKDWKAQVKKCHNRISEEYKFWVQKSTGPGRDTRLVDISRDAMFIKKLEHQETISPDQQKRLNEVIHKYGIQ